MLGAAFALVSCDSPNYLGEDSKDKGEVNLSKLVIKLDAKAQTISKAGDDVSNFQVRIYNRNGGALVNQFVYKDMPEVLSMAVGEYRIEVNSPKLEEAAFDAPYFKGEAEFTILKNQITNIGSIICTLQNVKVSIRYSNALQQIMSDDVSTLVKVAGNQLTYNHGEERAGYFKYYSENTTLVATFSGTVDGVKIEEVHQVITDIQPNKHYIITFSYKTTPVPDDEGGYIGTSGITIDATVEIENESRNVEVDEPVIDPFDFLNVAIKSITFSCDASSKVVAVKASGSYTVESSAPEWCHVGSINANGFTVSADANTDPVNGRSAVITVTMGSITRTITVDQAKYVESLEAPYFTSEYVEDLYDETSGFYNDVAEFGVGKKPAVVQIHAPNGIAHVNVKIDSEGLKLSDLTDVGLDTEFDLATGMGKNTGKDLTAGLAGLGFPVANGGSVVGGDGNTYEYEAVIGKNDVDFTITGFMPLLMPFKGHHNFIVEVIDQAGKSSTATIKFESK